MSEETFDTLPPECVLPIGVEWCEVEGRHGEYCFWVIRIVGEGELGETLVPWRGLWEFERTAYSARCAMWWQDYLENCKDDAGFNTGELEAVKSMFAWRKLWRKLEGS